MAKWIPMPEGIRAALDQCINVRYADILAQLPDLGFENPSVTHEVTADGFNATVKFHTKDDKSVDALFEYKRSVWHMYRDWND